MRTSSENSEAADGVAERMHAVVRALATGKRDVRARLYVAGSILLALQEHDFPPELQPLFTKIQRALTHRESENDAGRLQTTLHRMQNVTGERIARDVFSLYEHVQKLRGRSIP